MGNIIQDKITLICKIILNYRNSHTFQIPGEFEICEKNRGLFKKSPTMSFAFSSRSPALRFATFTRMQGTINEAMHALRQFPLHKFEDVLDSSFRWDEVDAEFVHDLLL